MMQFPCSQCVYDKECFPVLKALHRICKQGRKKAQKTLQECSDVKTP